MKSYEQSSGVKEGFVNRPRISGVFVSRKPKPIHFLIKIILVLFFLLSIWVVINVFILAQI